MRLKFNLSFIMFIHVGIFGIINPIISFYFINKLHFTPSQAGIILAVSSIPFLISPFISAFIAGIYISSEKLFALFHFAAAAIMLAFYYQKDFYIVLVLFTLYRVVTAPTLSIINAIVFQHSEREKYGSIRLWGTMGWVAAAWLSGSFIAAAILSIVVGTITLFIFSKQKFKKKESKTPDMSCLQVLIKPEVILLISLNLSLTIADQYYFFFTAPVLKQLGLKEYFILPAMSIAQISEIFTMYALAHVIKNIRYKTIIMIGILTEMARFACYSIVKTAPVLIATQLIHGPAFVFTIIVSLIYLDKHCDEKSRSGVQLIYGVLTMGLGSIIGNYVAGQTGEFFTDAVSRQINYNMVFLVPLSISLLTLLGMIIFYRRDRRSVNGKLQTGRPQREAV